MLKPSRFLDPKSDVVFKKIFGHHPDVMMSFLNGILPLEVPIVSLTYLSSKQAPRIPTTMKNTIADVKCTDEKGNIFIVEMQLHWSDSFKQRLLFGASKAYVKQLEKGKQYNNLCPVYGVGIVNAIFDHESPEWFHHYKMVHQKETNKVLEGLQLFFLELPKFQPQTFIEKRVGVLWLRFLREIDEKMQDVPEEFFSIPEIGKALELAQESSFTKAELEAYDKYWDAVSVENTIKGDAFDQGREEGREEGFQQGKEEERIEIARKMFASGMDIETVSALTGLSLENLKQLV